MQVNVQDEASFKIQSTGFSQDYVRRLRRCGRFAILAAVARKEKTETEYCTDLR
jgi:hypothetical protein